jgi:pimeloyl-ACP methyl ester carboxylesterase
MIAELPQPRDITLHAVTTEYIDAGEGRPLLFLHAAEGPDSFSSQYLHGLVRSFRVIAPWHPGFGRTPRPPEFRDVGDLAYFYLDFLEALDLRDVLLVGASFGGWIAAEIAIRSTDRLSALALVSPLGVKAGKRDERDIADMYAMTPDEWTSTAFVEPSHGRRDLASLGEEQLNAVIRGRHSLAHFGWKPYMHNPRLPRWLHRIHIPTLILRGAADRIVSVACHDLYAEAIAGARLQLIGGAGHYPHIEQPDEFVQAITAFEMTARSSDIAA